MTEKNSKVVRDKIPEIIRNSGKQCSINKLPDVKFLIEIEKLLEEVKEYLESKSEAELADILEVIYRIAELKGLKPHDLEKIRKGKALTHGTFSMNYFMTELTET